MNPQSQTNIDQTITSADAAKEYEVVVIGGGPAGSSAGVFTARADLKTLILEDGRSTLQKCAHLENYLGFPAGIWPKLFVEMMRDHTAMSGCDRIQESVTTVCPDERARFAVEVADKTIRANAVLVASWSHIEYFKGFELETVVEEHGDVEVLLSDEAGRTDIDGLYAAGRITQEPHQAIINAGAGARTARAIIEDHHPAFYNDWVAPEGYYEHWDRDIPSGVEEISHEERRERVRRSAEMMQSYFSQIEETDGP